MAEEYFETNDRKLAKKIRRSGQPHYKKSFSDIVMSVITYIVYTFFAFVCLYPFYYIFINTIS
nr:hypothetical protein [Lachnospiraceae bacterium]